MKWLKSTLNRSASVLWSGATAAMRFGVASGILKSQDLGTRVVSVGNLQAGGAGKTPLVAQIAREALERGLRVCILSRGYKGLWEKTGGILKPSDQANPALAGDEPVLLHELVPGAFIGVGADRGIAFRNIEQQCGKMDLVVLDDGFQHWRIRKDTEVVAVTSSKRNEVPYREAWSALKYADLVVWTKGASRPNTRGKPSAKVRFAIPRSSKTSGTRVWLVCGVAHPEHVYEAVQAAGYNVERFFSYADHALYDLGFVRKLIKEAEEANCRVALTGKDWVKWKALGVLVSQVLVLEPEVIFEEGREAWNRVLWGQ